MGNQQSNHHTNTTLEDHRRALIPSHFPGNENHRSNGKKTTPAVWDDKAVRRLVSHGKLAPRLPGAESRVDTTDQECPICFLYFSDVNATRCCNAVLCTECYLQVRPPNDPEAPCPFCSTPKFTIQIAKKLSAEEGMARVQEELESEKASKLAHRANSLDGMGGFGANLEKDSRVANFRARSESLCSSENEDKTVPGADAKMIQSIAMTPEERRRLEDEMRGQSTHPLALQMEAEAHQRQLQHDQEFNTSGQRQARPFRRRGRASRGTSGRLGLQTAMERATMDDLAALEAVIMDLNGRRSSRSRNSNSGGGGGVPPRPPTADTRLGTAFMLLRGISEEEQLAMAIAASLQESATTTETAAATATATATTDAPAENNNATTGNTPSEPSSSDTHEVEDIPSPSQGSNTPVDDSQPLEASSNNNNSNSNNDSSHDNNNPPEELDETW
eukprot:Nitzschia sp. Nitz4//scaffold412_size15754//6801//8322//NITZ4_008871-RA/size15754-snap-gene-0.8-mRNA-1//1//CDS//3329551324//6621//frame0